MTRQILHILELDNEVDRVVENTKFNDVEKKSEETNPFRSAS